MKHATTISVLNKKRRGRHKKYINGCIIRSADKKNDFNFADHIIILNSSNRIGIEINGMWVRIDGVKASNQLDFNKLMDTAKLIAEMNGIKSLFFADSAEERLLEYFRAYGFTEDAVEPYNHYLTYPIADIGENRYETE